MSRHRKRFLDPDFSINVAQDKQAKKGSYKKFLEPQSPYDSSDSCDTDPIVPINLSNDYLYESEDEENEYFSIENEIDSLPENDGTNYSYAWSQFETYGNQKLYEGAPLDFKESYSIILAYSLRFGLSFEATTALMEVLNGHLPIPSLEMTKYKLFRLLQPILSKKKKHFVCRKCKTYIGEINAQCISCSSNQATTDTNVESFITVPVEVQLKGFFDSHPSFVECLKPSTQINGTISDITQSYGYQKLQPHEYVISLMVSTDGVQLFKSSKLSLWPISFFIAELPPKDRIKNQFVYTIWAGQDPPISAMFEPLIKEVNELERNGIIISANNIEIKAYVRILQSINDTPGRSKVQGLVGLRGEFSCGWCTHKGEMSGGRIFPMAIPMPELRSAEQFIENVEELQNNGFNSPVNGISSVSPLYGLPNFDLAKSFPVDYMHSVLQGMMKHLLYLWTDHKLRYKPYSIHPSIETINKELRAIRIPYYVTRLPRMIDDKVKWKSNEFRNFLLYYSLPLLKDRLKEDFYVHYAKFVHIVYETLRESGLAVLERQSLQVLIDEFLTEFEILYGKESLRYNFHLFYHVIHSYENCGPTWATSMFPFESKNQTILRFISGTRNVSDQCMTRFSMLSALNSIDTPHPLTEKYLSSNVFLKKFLRGSDSVTGLGPTKQVAETLICSGRSVQMSEEFRRISYQNRIYTSTEYDSRFRRCISIVKLKDNTLGKLIRIYFSETNNRFYAAFNEFYFKNLKVGTITFTGMYVIQESMIEYVICVDDITCSCVCVASPVGIICCIAPSTVESD